MCWVPQVAETAQGRKQKWGWRAGILTRLRNQPHKPLLPSLFLSNTRPIIFKMDHMEPLQSLLTNLYKTATTIPDATVQLIGCTLHRQDHSINSCKSRHSDSATHFKTLNFFAHYLIYDQSFYFLIILCNIFYMIVKRTIICLVLLSMDL